MYVRQRDALALNLPQKEQIKSMHHQVWRWAVVQLIQIFRCDTLVALVCYFWLNNLIAGQFFHQGTHEHSKPPLDTKIDPDSYKQLENIVLISPEITPVQLKVGTSTRDPVSSIHPSFANNDKLKYHRGKTLNNNTKTDYLLDVINDISAVEPNFFRKYDILNEHRHFLMQDDGMVKLLRNADCVT